MTVAAVVPAAGRGERLGPGLPKALRDVGGLPILVHAVHGLALAPSVDHVVVAAPADDVPGVRTLLDGHDMSVEVVVVPGGATRQSSVAAALRALPGAVDVVLVHDAARPFVPVDVVERVVAAVRGGAPAVVPALPVHDTIKQVDPAGRVVATVDRAPLVAVQTPQGFRRDVLVDAHTAAAARDDDGVHTDDAGLVEWAGVPVIVVPGDPEGFKITRPFDLLVADALLAGRRPGRG